MFSSLKHNLLTLTFTAESTRSADRTGRSCTNQRIYPGPFSATPDPDVPLAQGDEDELLGVEPPVLDENGKFVALQVQMELGTAAYATMALREITKTETSAAYQTTLTRGSEDQRFRGTAGTGQAEDTMEV